jgi:hypothetical protein
MTAPLARTRHEANLFVDVTPCECGEPRLPRSRAEITLPDGSPGARLAGTCPRCGRERVFQFRVPEVSEDVPADDEVIFGFRSTPSELLDVGQWVAVAQAYAGAVPPDPAALTGAERDLARRQLMAAVGAVIEALKFQRVRAEPTFWSDLGRATYERDPGLFTVFRLEELQFRYEAALRATDGPAEAAKRRIDPERGRLLANETVLRRAWADRHGIGATVPTPDGDQIRTATPSEEAELRTELRQNRGLDVVTGGSPRSALSGLLAFQALLDDVRARWRSDPPEVARRLDRADMVFQAWRAHRGIDDGAWGPALFSTDPSTDVWSVRDQPLPPAELVWELVHAARQAVGVEAGH